MKPKANDEEFAPVRPMEGPGGLDLDPDPPETVRVSKRAAGAVGVIVTILLALFAYGGYRRQIRAQTITAENQPKSVVPATAAATEIMKEIPSATVPSLDPSPHKSESRHDLHPITRLQRGPGASDRLAARHAVPAAQWNDSLPHPANVPTAEDRQLLVSFQQEQQAMAAPTPVNRTGWGGFGGGPASVPAGGDDMARIAGLMRTLSGRSAVTTAAAKPVAGEGTDYAQQNGQTRKEAFLAQVRTGNSDDYLPSRRTAPMSPFEIKAGWEIPAAMEQALNSDLPGEVKALVTSNVYDTATGAYLLIPQGSRLVGAYDSHVGYAQEGVQVVWNRLLFPDGSSIDLNGMAGQDLQGYSGFRQSVDHHYRRLLGFAVLTSLFSAGFELSQSRNRNVLSYASPGEVAAGAVGREISEMDAQVTRRNLNVQPTIKIPVGYRFNVRVNRDILFEAPYEPPQPNSPR